MTYFRKRLGPDAINQVNKWIVQAAREDEGDEGPTDDSPGSSGGDVNNHLPAESQGPQTHQGKLILDATCAPAYAAYPTDSSLLNAAREKLEGIIDTLHSQHIGDMKKPRDQRRQARRDYLRTEALAEFFGSQQRTTPQQLTPRQQQVLNELNAGKGTTEIARHLKITNARIRQYRHCSRLVAT